MWALLGIHGQDLLTLSHFFGRIELVDAEEYQVKNGCHFMISGAQAANYCCSGDKTGFQSSLIPFSNFG
jgi:hypothetical protein